ncbi:MAG: glycosyltransferase, partial [Planctomycetes bacterium]|nr:glycosyltransferase [Planctomycetota bacterium]
WPVCGDHLRRAGQGAWVLTHRKKSLDPALTAAQVDACLLDANPEMGGSLYQMGMGLGELVEALLERQPHTPICAWERDPWILRQALCLHDWSHAIEDGRLKILLNADLTERLQDVSQGTRIWHPLFGRLYSEERRLVESGAQSRRALVCAGTLFVDSLTEGLERMGYSVLPLHVQGLSNEESERVVRTWKPHVIASINAVDGLAEFAAAQGIPHFTWEIDPALTPPRALSRPAPHSHVFTYRKESMASFTRAGFEHVQYMPLAADPHKRFPRELTGEQVERYAASVSFVGASMVDHAAPFQQAFLSGFQSWCGAEPSVGQQVMQRVLGFQRQDFSRYVIPETLDQLCPGFRTGEVERGAIDPAHYLGEVAAAEKRLNYVAALAQHGASVWGDGGWQRLQAHGITYKGPALHETELPLIYSGTRINVDVGRIYQSDIVTMRIFDILACGGFVLAEHSEALAELFEIGVEVESYRTQEELKAKVAHYLAHPEAARAIAERGRRAVLERHTIDGRLQAMLEAVLGRCAPAADSRAA